MKSVFLVLFVICPMLTLFTCSQESPVAPEPIESSESNITAEIEQMETMVSGCQSISSFTGTSVFVANLDPGVVKILPNGKVRVSGKINQWYDDATDPRATIKNAVAVPPAGIDRSPCGTGTSAKMATLFAKGELGLHEEFVHESIIGSLFYGELVEETRVGDYSAVIPTIRGSAHIMGIHQFVLDPRDPFPAGFLLGRQEKLYGVGFEL